MSDRTLELRLVAKDMMSAVVEGAQKSFGGLADAIKAGATGAAGAWPQFSAGFTTTIDDIVSGVGVAKEVLGTLKQAWDFAKEGAENERIANSFQATADSVGVDAQRMSDALNKAAKGTVDDEAYMQTATRNMALGMATDLNSNVQLMELARSASIKFGGDTETAFEGISTAIGNLQTRQLKQYGIIVDTKTANENYAKAIGTTVDKLTEAEQRTALLNDVMEKSKTVFGDVTNQALTTAEKFKKFETQVGNLGDVVKEQAVDAFTPYLDSLNGMETLLDANATYADKLRVTYESMRSRGIDPASDAMVILKQRIEEATAVEKSGADAATLVSDKMTLAFGSQKKALADVQTQSQYTRDALKEYALATQQGSQASQDFAKWLSEGVAARMADLKTVMAGAVLNENKQYIDQEQTLAEKAAKLRDEIDKLSASQGRAVSSTKKQGLSAAEATLASLQLAKAQGDLNAESAKGVASDEALAAAAAKVKENKDKLEGATKKEIESNKQLTAAKQALGDAQATLNNNTDPMKQAELAVKVEKLKNTLGEATGAVISYVDNSKKIGELSKEYDAINAEIEKNAAKHEEATKRILFGYLEQETTRQNALKGITGYTDDQVKFFDLTAQKMGLKSAGDVLAYATIAKAAKLSATDQAGAQALIDLALKQSTDAVWVYYAALNSLPRDILISIRQELVDTGDIPNMGDSKKTPVTKPTTKPIAKPSRPGGAPRADGGDVFAGLPYWVGEQGAEPFVPNVDGRILSRQDAMSALKGAKSGGNVINVALQANVASQVDVEEMAYRVSEVIGRRLQAYA